jgi:type IV pilus assembly protein PilE
MLFKIFGFTLLEMMLALAISAILMSLSYVSYQHYLMNTARMNAKIILWQAVSYLENYYSEHGTYQGVSLSFPAPVPHDRYRYVLSHVSSSTYVLSAIPQGAQLQDEKCGALHLNEKNEPWNDGFASQNSCWAMYS